MSTDLRPYPKYKDSGLPWLGRVPAHWDLVRMKHLLQERNLRGFPDEPLLAATQAKGVVRKEDYENRTVLALKDLHLLKLVEVGDFVISLRSFQGGIEHARHRGIISPAYTVIYPYYPSLHAYLASLFKSQPFIDALRLYVTGIRQGQNIDYVRLSRSPIPVPPSKERAVIVRFVTDFDRRCRRFIRNRRRLIEVLNEQKQAIINLAVTRGIDPNAPLKPSGIDWLGEIPKHWEVVPLKRVGWFKSGAGFPVTSQGRTSLECPFYRVSDMNSLGNDKFMVHSSSTISRDEAGLLGANVFPVGTIIFPKVGGALLTNKRRILKHPSCIDNNIMGCVVTGAEVDYVFLILRLIDLGRVCKPGPVPAIGEGDVRNIRIPLPPVEEQRFIVERERVEAAEVKTAMNIVWREIDIIREYRTRLIADVVTGKVDVRGIEVPVVAEEELPALDEDNGEPDDVIDDELESEVEE